MGSTNTKVTSGVKAQAAGITFDLYSLVNVKGGGELIDLMKDANKSRNYKELDRRIIEGVKPFLYNEGRGKIVDIREILAYRSCKASPEINFEMSDTEFIKANGYQTKEICWKLDKLGAVGETILHTCLLSSTASHADLAKRLLKHFPKLIKDMYLSDEYYGENVLHMAIVNEDPAMVKFLLDHEADIHQRCCGNFFLPEDQKVYKTHSWLHEWYDLPTDTNYYGYTYWGEYPIGFAACLGQEECVRLLVANGADPNLVDSNGNTVLHLLVIHDQKMRERAMTGKVCNIKSVL
ncbi:DgyrCDS13866 [Dimorphilus gyrociliatus]|uniref:DgyrCDS13866 n=1 Tax=Dimorphilus gyrociliatus TaxID=2664684 RepID=A0A7I8WC08_9ANNE|nr:DgyrCDS13866 [Dimorphilus gyrociliatus]